MVKKKQITAYVELWFDAEETQSWRITVWYVSDKDFDPFTTDYKTLDFASKHIHEAKKYQEAMSTYLKKAGFKIYTNNYNQDSYFWLRPAWFERLISNL